jgi:hypothetical protein
VKRLLTWVTLVATLAVVAVLATYLILVATTLVRADRNLARLIKELRKVRDNAEPLETDLATIHDATVALHARLKSIDSHLAGIVGLVHREDEIRQGT